MARQHRTVYLDEDVLELLRGRKEATGESSSQMINDAVRNQYQTQQAQFGALCRDVAAIRALLESQSPK
jgi:hypothetical protein